MALHCFRPTRFVKVAVELFRNCDSYSCKSSTDNDQRRWHWRDEPPQSCSVQTLWYKLLLESVKDCKQKHILFVALRSINVRLHIHPLLHVRGMKLSEKLLVTFYVSFFLMSFLLPYFLLFSFVLLFSFLFFILLPLFPFSLSLPFSPPLIFLFPHFSPLSFQHVFLYSFLPSFFLLCLLQSLFLSNRFFHFYFCHFLFLLSFLVSFNLCYF